MVCLYRSVLHPLPSTVLAIQAASSPTHPRLYIPIDNSATAPGFLSLRCREPRL